MSGILETLEEMKTVNQKFLQDFLNYAANAANDQVTFYGITLNTQGGRGNHERDQIVAFGDDKQAFITAVQDNIRSRFPQLDLLDAMQVRCIDYVLWIKIHSD